MCGKHIERSVCIWVLKILVSNFSKTQTSPQTLTLSEKLLSGATIICYFHAVCKAPKIRDLIWFIQPYLLIYITIRDFNLKNKRVKEK